MGDFLGTIVNGRVDRGIGCILPYAYDDMTGQPKRRSQSPLLVVEPKTAHNLAHALPQLVVYLAPIH